MRTPELNQVSQMMSSMNVGMAGGGGGMQGAMGMQVRRSETKCHVSEPCQKGSSWE